MLSSDRKSISKQKHCFRIDFRLQIDHAALCAHQLNEMLSEKTLGGLCQRRMGDPAVIRNVIRRNETANDNVSPATICHCFAESTDQSEIPALVPRNCANGMQTERLTLLQIKSERINMYARTITCSRFHCNRVRVNKSTSSVGSHYRC